MPAILHCLSRPPRVALAHNLRALSGLYGYLRSGMTAKRPAVTQRKRGGILHF